MMINLVYNSRFFNEWLNIKCFSHSSKINLKIQTKKATRHYFSGFKTLSTSVWNIWAGSSGGFLLNLPFFANIKDTFLHYIVGFFTTMNICKQNERRCVIRECAQSPLKKSRCWVRTSPSGKLPQEISGSFPILESRRETSATDAKSQWRNHLLSPPVFSFVMDSPLRVWSRFSFFCLLLRMRRGHRLKMKPLMLISICSNSGITLLHQLQHCNTIKNQTNNLHQEAENMFWP